MVRVRDPQLREGMVADFFGSPRWCSDSTHEGPEPMNACDLSPVALSIYEGVVGLPETVSDAHLIVLFRYVDRKVGEGEITDLEGCFICTEISMISPDLELPEDLI